VSGAPRPPSLLRELTLAVAWIAGAAAAGGMAEAAWLVARGAVPIGGARLVTAAALLYGVLGVAVAIALVALRRLLAAIARSRRPLAPPGAGDPLAWHFAAALALAVVAAVAWPLNRRLLADALAPPSLAANGALLLVAAPLLARALRRPCARLAAAASTPAGRRFAGAAALLVAIAAVVPLAASSPTDPPRPREVALADRPNLLLVVVDTLRADRLGCYGHARPTSPRLDALAAQGVLFEHCLSQAPHTKPSVASLLTGRVPTRLGVEPFGAPLPADELPLAEQLRAAGYRTGLFSANAFVAPTFGFAQGIDRYVGPLVSPAAPLAAFHVLARLRDLWVEALSLPEAPWRAYESLVSAPFDLTGQRHDPRAAELCGEVLRFVDAGGRWFAHLQLMETHAPYRPRAAHRLFPAARESADLPSAARHLFLPFARAEPLPPAELAALTDSYDACVHDVDAEVGALLDALAARGLLDETIVVVTADHGEEFFDHGGFGHGHSLHRELLHVPLIVRAPDRLPAGRRVATQVRLIDVVPTLQELLDLAPAVDAPRLDGESLLPLLRERDADPAPARPAFASVEWGGSRALATRDGERTLIVAREGAEERVLVFDPRADPLEQRDLSADPREAETVAATVRALKAFAESTAAGRAASRDAALDPATKSLLERLGYAGE